MSKYDTLRRSTLGAGARRPCFGCNTPFPTAQKLAAESMPKDENISPTERYRCAKCGHDFCTQCDM